MKPILDTRMLKEAATWLVRCDRGLTAAEQDAYFEWLGRDARHGPMLRRMDRLWNRLNALAFWRPRHSAQANPDLLAMPHSWRRIACFLGAAAAVVLLGALFTARWVVHKALPDVSSAPAIASTAQPQPSFVRREPERLVLPDGTVVNFVPGTRLEIAFVEQERRIRMGVGRAHFSVSKDPTRPFVVETAHGSVRAVGTAFDVRQEQRDLAVTVTEGVVRVATGRGPHSTGAAVPAVVTAHAEALAAAPLVNAGQRAVVHEAAQPQVSNLTPAELERDTAWLAVQLEFHELPLPEVLAEFARYRPHTLRLAEPAIGDVRIGGTFRADQAEVFAALLEKRFGFSVEHRGDEIVIGRRRR